MTATSRRPLIAIPARFSESASALRYRAVVLPRTLVAAVHDAGGEPVMIHPVAGAEPRPDEVAERLAFADGIVLPGGGDLDPRWTGQSAHPAQYDVDAEQDAFDLAVAQFAIEQGVPLLAICRGLQVVNAARGGDLVQDMGDGHGHHRHKVHTAAVDPGTSLHEIVGSQVEVSCYHHQSLGRLGANLTTVARAEDGTSEAVELVGGRGWFLGVQWHPEDAAATHPQQAALFTTLVDRSQQFHRIH